MTIQQLVRGKVCEEEEGRRSTTVKKYTDGGVADGAHDRDEGDDRDEYGKPAVLQGPLVKGKHDQWEKTDERLANKVKINIRQSVAAGSMLTSRKAHARANTGNLS